MIGLGGVGKKVLDLLPNYKNYKLLDVYSVSGRYDGFPLGKVCDTNFKKLRVKKLSDYINNNIDVFIHATRSFPEIVIPEIEVIVRSGSNVISTSEYLANLKVNYPKEAVNLNQLAIDNNVSIVGLGVNPGYVFDYLPLSLAVSKSGIKKIKIKRIVDGSVFGEFVWSSLGLNISQEEFLSKTSNGKIKAHIGFKESATMIIEGLKDKIDSFDETIEPITSKGTGDSLIKKGLVASFIHKAKTLSTNGIVLEFELILHTNLIESSLDPEDEIFIDAATPLNAKFTPGFDAHETTASNILNNVELINRFDPGLWSATDMQPSKSTK